MKIFYDEEKDQLVIEGSGSSMGLPAELLDAAINEGKEVEVEGIDVEFKVNILDLEVGEIDEGAEEE